MKYRLLKDLPWDMAGTEFTGKDMAAWRTSLSIIDYFVDNKFAIAHPNFFSPIPDTPKRPKTVWDLEDGDRVWNIISYDVDDIYWNTNDYCFRQMRESWDVFLTKEDAQRELSYRKAKTAILKHHAEMGWFVPNWDKREETKYEVRFSHENPVFFASAYKQTQGQSICYFPTVEEAQQSIKDCEKEWKVIFNVK